MHLSGCLFNCTWVGLAPARRINVMLEVNVSRTRRGQAPTLPSCKATKLHNPSFNFLDNLQIQEKGGHQAAFFVHPAPPRKPRHGVHPTGRVRACPRLSDKRHVENKHIAYRGGGKPPPHPHATLFCKNPLTPAAKSAIITTCNLIRCFCPPFCWDKNTPGASLPGVLP